MEHMNFSGKNKLSVGSGAQDWLTPKTIIAPFPDRALSPNARSRTWHKKNRLAQKYKTDCFNAALAAGIRKIEPQPVRITLTFHPPNNNRRDDDNMVASFKSGRDGIALALGIDDSLFDVEKPILGPAIKPHGAVVITVQLRAE